MRKIASSTLPSGVPPPDPDTVGRLIVRAPNWLGDLVLSLPALRALRRRFAGAELHLMLRRGLDELLRGHPDADGLIVEDRPAGGRSPAGPFRGARRLAAGAFDVAVILARSFESALTVRLAGIPVRAGLACQHRGFLLTHPVPETPERQTARHHAEVLLDVARALGADGPAGSPDLALRSRDAEAAAALLSGAGLATGQAYLVVHPGASKAERTWPAERFGAVAASLAREHGLRVLVLGTPSEAALCRVAADATGPAAVPLGPVSGLRTLAAIHREAALVLGNDSGAMHLAAAAGAPVVGLFGPGDPLKTAPLPGPGGFEAVTLAFPCSPCRQRFFRECEPAPDRRPYCLHDIPAERVLETARRLLASTAA